MRRSLFILGLIVTTATTSLLTPRAAMAVKVRNVTRMAVARTNVLTGMGLVIGLKGTGDGGAYLPAIKPLAQLLGRYADPASVSDLANANNVAIVMVTATMPKDGVRNGEHLDVRVASTGAASSLQGGTLYMASMLGPMGQPYVPHDANGIALRPVPFATATGEVHLEDSAVPTSGIVKGGATMECDLPAKYVDRLGRFTLIIDDPSASWQLASAMAKLINEAVDQHGPDGEPVAVAVAVDPKNVLVRIPDEEYKQPDTFIANVLQLSLPNLPGEAQVRINDKNGTIIVTGEVEIGPAVITHKGLSITTMSPPQPASALRPQRIQHGVVTLDTTNTGGARLQDLADVFDQLKVPTEDRIDILKELYDTGKLHAKLYVNGIER